VFNAALAQEWDSLSTFERNLFRVCEISLFGLELERRFASIPFLRLKLEEFSEQTPRQIIEFFGLNPADYRDHAIPKSNKTKRLARGARSVGRHWRCGAERSWVRETGAKLGYDMSPTGLQLLQQRMSHYDRQGRLEQVAGLAYRVSPVRRLFRRVIVPLRVRWSRRS
jgi:hypothetical protein